MRILFRLYLIISILGVVYFLSTARGNDLILHLALWALIFNIIIVIPITMYQKTNNEEKEKINKMLIILSVFSILFGMFFVHLVHFGTTWVTNGLLILFAWGGSIIYIVSVIVAVIAVSLGINLYMQKSKTKQSKCDITYQVLSNFIFPVSSIFLIIWAFLIIIETILEIT